MKVFTDRQLYKGFNVKQGYGYFTDEKGGEYITSGFTSGDYLKAYKHIGGNEWVEQDWCIYDNQDELLYMIAKFERDRQIKKCYTYIKERKITPKKELPVMVATDGKYGRKIVNVLECEGGEQMGKRISKEYPIYEIEDENNEFEIKVLKIKK